MSKLIDRASGFEIDALPFAGHDALPDLLRSLLLFGHGVRVVKLLQASGANGGMLAFIATMQALVPHGAVAIAVTGLLIEHFGNLSCQREGVSLHGFILPRSYLHFLRSKQTAERLALGRRPRMIGRNLGRFAHPLGGAGDGKRSNAQQRPKASHKSSR